MNNSNASNTQQANLIDTVAAQGTLGTFSKAINAAGLANILNGPGPFTVFAPSDAAFEKLPAGQLEGWMKPENKDQLISVLKYHVSPGRATGQDIGKLTEAKTVNGQPAQIKRTGDSIMIDNATITTRDVGSSNGVVHVIDQVLTPTKH
ncbi:MAG TPA: fasciclin domain-containing protein [Rhodanobacteraceae bacterium]|nr:fasciclin domain-containing protein [Rhodanobacteraceae bacterium]